MTRDNDAVAAFEKWYNGLTRYAGGIPAKGTMAGALVVLDHLQTDWNLSPDAHTAKGGSQVKGASGAAVASILARLGETRPFVSEGGRTNRGLRGDIISMLKAIEGMGLDDLDATMRNATLQRFQAFLVERVRDFHAQQRLKYEFDPTKSTFQSMRDLLDLARETGKEGPVAQYLVGAKLQRRFPELEISNDSYSTKDAQLGRHGDFSVGDTAFHVTVSPMEKVYIRCEQNLADGFRVYLLVPANRVAGARENADNLGLLGKIAIESIESFVGQNIDELAVFSKEQLIGEIRGLLQTYNQRVGLTELDKSMLIELPPNLEG